ncbi:MAG: hypothetical protein GTO71_07290 [Woeseiaceae bacterium]|nr:hypothetical protein [Woeseiaceae bacterium]NIP20899.1 hypothetical protein [Woeseiaceae bacterium]NIS89666.1 hypothetical protein [Woeseiaceae bacterium]
MRKLLLLLVLVLAACSNDGGGSKGVFEPVQHLPEILGVTLSPTSALQWEGDGSVVVTVEITFSDTGRDIKTMLTQMPDGSIIEFDEDTNSATGTFIEDFVMPTDQIGVFLMEFWLVDKAGDNSTHRVAYFSVIDDGQPGDWRSQVSGLPHVLTDVTWDRDVFIAVGKGGSVLTSVDGIDWAEQESGTDVNLAAVAAYGSAIFAVGENTLLLSADHGETWTIKNTHAAVSLRAVAANASRIVVGGETGLVDPVIMVSEDRGDSWQVIFSWPDPPMYFTDLIYRNGLFLAAADTWFFRRHGGWVFVSSNGSVWNEIFYDPESGFTTIIDDGSRFTVAGSDGAAITSLDGLNWTEMQTPLGDVDYWSGASNGSKVVLAGGYDCEFIPCSPPSKPPVGIASTDGGLSWDIFNIGGEYESLGMAFGNGRFVSVGRSAPDSDQGAIYTTVSGG